jgi:Starch-binding associating with outer membrane
MKLNLKLVAIMSVSSIIAFSSCSKKIDDAYANPNAAVRQPVELIYPSLIGSLTGSSSAAGSAYGMCGDALLIGRYIQFWGSYVSSTTDNIGTFYDKMAGTTGASDNLGSMWASHYYGMGQNLNRIVQWGTEEQKWDFVGAAWALRAWSMFECTNEYGEMILRQAFNTSLQQFTYEDQSEVYDSVRVTCHRAIGYLSMTGGAMNPTTFAASDFYFNKGDLGRWKKFVYGILARSYANIHNKTSYSADSVIKYCDLSITSNADNATAKFQSTGITGTSNFFGSARSNVNQATSGIRQSKFIADLMSGANPLAFTGVFDPRAWYMLRENNNGTFKGYTASYSSAINPVLPLGDSSRSFVGTNYQATGYASPEQGRYIFRDAAEFPVMTASEMQFLKAEALIRKNDFINAKIAYVNGISLNFDMLMANYNTNVPTANLLTATLKANYLADPNIVPATANATTMTLTKVMLQKYIALYGWGVHVTWADMRRYHYNNLDPATGQQVYAGFIVPSLTNLFSGSSGSNNGKLVYRCRPRYNSEYLYNIPALTSIGAYPPGNDYHTKETWFSKP